MPFCSECGYNIPDDAKFCPECGNPVQAGSKTPPINCTQQTQCSCKSPQFKNNSNYPTYNAHQPQNTNISNQFSANGIPAVKPPKSKNNTIALVVIASIVVLAIIALIFFVKGNSKGSYVGYWESTKADLGDGNLVDDYLGIDVQGMICLQINKNGIAFIGTPIYDDILKCTWDKTDDGIALEYDGERMYFTSTGNKLVTQYDEMALVLSKSEGDINDFSGTLDSIGSNTHSSVNNSQGGGYVGSGDFYVDIVGAVDALDTEGKGTVRFYYIFTNEFVNSISAWHALGFKVEQDGKQLDETFTWDDVPEYNNANKNIRPGVSIQCIYESNYDPNGGPINFSVYDYYDGEEGSIVATYMPGSFPGQPTPYEITPVENPEWGSKLKNSGTLDDNYHVFIDDAILMKDYTGNDAIKVFYEFTNNSKEACSMGYATQVYTYQDGVSLDETIEESDSEESKNFDLEIMPGETIRCCRIFLLRNKTSGIEADVESLNTYKAVGATYAMQ